MRWDLHAWILLWGSLLSPSESLKTEMLLVDLIRNMNLSSFARAWN